MIGAMNRIWLLLLPAALAAGILAGPASANEASVTGQEQVSPRLMELTVSTPAFAEPTKLHVFLPAGYESSPKKRWPVTYVLAGTQNNYNSFADFLGGESLTAEYPSILVSPDGNSGYWSDWHNGGAFGPPQYETFVIDQLIPLIDSRYRTIPDRAQRAVFGISMGGYGSMMLAARHPDLFGSAATISGAVDSNLPLLGAALSISSTFDGGAIDAINGSRATQEVRWHGRNPTDLASNLRGMDIQVRTANGVLNPGIGEGESPDDALSCLVENGVFQGSTSMHERLDELGVDHLWKDYGNGCHTVANFTRQVSDTLAAFERNFADPPASPAGFEYRTIEPRFGIWGWNVDADQKRALEFMTVRGGRNVVSLEGSGLTSVTTPPWYRGLKKVDVNRKATRPGAGGRLRFTVDLGPAHTGQQYTPDGATSFNGKKVTLRPHALLRITKVKRIKRGVRVCVRAIGGTVPKARIKAGKRSAKVKVGAKVKCVKLLTARKTRTVTVRGKDTFGHPVNAKSRIRPRR